MRKLSRKMLCIILAICTLLGNVSLPVYADATTEKTEDAMEYSGHFYSLCRMTGTLKTWELAEKYCESAGGHLATITSQEEQDAVYSYIKTSTGLSYERIYFGLKQDSTTKEWNWVTGEKFDYTFWAEGEPNWADGPLSYGEYYSGYKETGQWNDDNGGHFGNNIYFLCEWESEDQYEKMVEIRRALTSFETSGDGTKNNPYKISDEKTLYAFLEKSGGENESSFDNQYIELTADITANDVSTYSSWNKDVKPERIWTGISNFNGHFEGNSHTIYGLYIEGADGDLGFFNNVGNSASISNVNISKSVLNVSLHTRTDENEKPVAIRYCAGMLVGVGKMSSVSGCSISGKILVDNNSPAGMDVGGVIGAEVTSGEIKNCQFDGEIGYYQENGDYLSVDSSVGGIIAHIDPSGSNIISDSLSSGTIDLPGFKNAAGIVGSIAHVEGNTLIIKQCGNYASINGSTYIGGILGYTDSRYCERRIEYCFNKGKISADSFASGIVGGAFIAGMSFEVSNCYNAGNIGTTNTGWAGGLFGNEMLGSSGDVKIHESYTTGNVTGIKSGIVGIAQFGGWAFSSQYLTNVYYSGTNNIVGDTRGNAQEDIKQNVKEIPDGELANQSFYSGFNFSEIWSMTSDRPCFKWENSTDYDADSTDIDADSLEFLDSVMLEKGNIYTMKYLANDNNYANSVFVYENVGTFHSAVIGTITNTIYRGLDGWVDTATGEISIEQAEEILAKLLCNYSEKFQSVSDMYTATKYSKKLIDGLDDYIGAEFLEKGLTDKDIKNLKGAFEPEQLSEIISKHEYQSIADYLIKEKGYKKDSVAIKTLNSYMLSETMVQSCQDTFKTLKISMKGLKIGTETILKLLELEAIYNSDEFYSEMLSYIMENCKYSVMCDAAKRLKNAIDGEVKDQILYVSKSIKNNGTEFLVDKAIDKALTAVPIMIIIKKGFDWGADLSNFILHTGEQEELRDKMTSLAFLGNCLSNWLIESSTSYLHATTDKEKMTNGTKSYFAAYMLLQTRSEGEKALQKYINTFYRKKNFKMIQRWSNAISGSLDDLENTMFSKDNMKKLLTFVVACPVDVQVIDENGNQLAYIADGRETEYQADEVSYSVIYDQEDDDYIKIIHLPEESKAQIKCIASDEGAVDFMLLKTNDDGAATIDHIDDVEVKKGTEITVPELNDNNGGSSTVSTNTEGDITEYHYVTKDTAIVPISKITLDKKQISITEGQKIYLNKVIAPANATDKILYWSSDNDEIASVNGDGTVEGKSPGTATIEVASSATDKGSVTDTCIVTVGAKTASGDGNNTNQNSGSGNSGTGGSSNVTGNNKDKDNNNDDNGSEIKFADVQDSERYYYTPVYWAKGKGITSGVDEQHFGPDQPVTRGQMITFVYRYYQNKAANGTEKFNTDQSYTTPFTDLSSSYYIPAVDWAYGNEITSGTTPTTFSPDVPVTRGQMVTFLFRAAQTFGNEEITGDKVFDDIKAGIFYEDAVKWAAGYGVTSGTSENTFSPDSNCTRGQGVTFIYRADENGLLSR